MLNSFRTVVFSYLIIFLIPLNAISQNFVTTYAGTGSAGFENGDTSIASFNRPFGICIDPDGNLYLADSYNNCIRKIGIDGQVTIYAGEGIPGYQDGPANEARFNQPLNICLDIDGNMYVSDFKNQRIRKISADLQVTTLAGTGVAGYNEGLAMEAQFNYPRGICIDDTGNIYVGDSWNHRIRKISIDGVVSSWAGGGDTIGVQSVGSHKDASDTLARFYTPCELSIDEEGNIFVADAYNHRIRKIDPNRIVTTVAGSGESGPDAGGFENGPSASALFNVPTACHVVMDGTIYVGDGANQRVRKISPDQTVTTFAGSGETGFDNGSDSLATFDFPRGTVFDYERNKLYVVDYNNHAIRDVHLEDVTGIGEPVKSTNINIYPNPFVSIVSIEYYLSKKQTVSMIIFDGWGKQVDMIRQDQQKGIQQIIWNAEGQTSGLYYFVLQLDCETTFGKMMLLD